MNLLELLTSRGQIDAMFTPTGTGEVFSFRGRRRVLLPPAEAAAVRHTLYLLGLLPYATTIPLMLMAALMYRTLFSPLVGDHGAIWGWIAAAATGLLISMGVLVRYLYVWIVYRSFPEA